jgi:hypothetical protein
MAKLGFGGQWVDIAIVGKFNDSTSVERNLDRDFLSQVVANYTASEHEAPAVVGHPEEDAPAYGWVSDVRLTNDGILQARFIETDDAFEQLVKDGRLKKRSTAFYIEMPRGSAVKAPTIKHVGFLGAAAPSVKGLRNIQFAEGESFELEAETFNLQETSMFIKEEDLDKMPDTFIDKMKAKLGLTTKKGEGEGGDPAPQPAAASFSEAQAKELIAEAVKTVKADFKEQLDAKDKEFLDLSDKVDGQITGSRRAEVASFVESLPAEKGKHFLKRVGIVEFLERLADDDAADKDAKKAISFSEGEGEEKKTIEFSRFDFAKTLLNALPPFVEFGEKFGNIVATKEADVMINTDRVESMKKAAGVTATTEGGKD